MMITSWMSSKKQAYICRATSSRTKKRTSTPQPLHHLSQQQRRQLWTSYPNCHLPIEERPEASQYSKCCSSRRPIYQRIDLSELLCCSRAITCRTELFLVSSKRTGEDVAASLSWH